VTQIDTTDSLAELYAKRLESGEGTSSVLIRFFRDAFEVTPDKDDMVFLSRLTSLFGKWRVFYSLLEMATKRDTLRIQNKAYIRAAIKNHCAENFYKQERNYTSKDMSTFIKERKQQACQGIELKESLDD
jgi:hypothetical protein